MTETEIFTQFTSVKTQFRYTVAQRKDVSIQCTAAQLQILEYLPGKYRQAQELKLRVGES